MVFIIAHPLNNGVDRVDDAIGGWDVGVLDPGPRLQADHLDDAALEHLGLDLLAAGGVMDHPSDALRVEGT